MHGEEAPLSALELQTVAELHALLEQAWTTLETASYRARQIPLVGVCTCIEAARDQVGNASFRLVHLERLERGDGPGRARP